MAYENRNGAQSKAFGILDGSLPASVASRERDRSLRFDLNTLGTISKKMVHESFSSHGKNYSAGGC